MQQPWLTGFAGGALSIALNADDRAIEFKGADGVVQKFTPDATKGYFTFTLSTSFPATTAYGTCLHPNVVAASHKSLLHQNLNYEHQIALYHKDTNPNVTDRIIGFVAGVAYPSAPMGGWTIPKSVESAPAITGVAGYFKQATAVGKVVGEHLTGRHNYSVSMEVSYRLSESGFAVALNGGKPEFGFTPQDMLEAGWEYVPTVESPKELAAAFSTDKRMIVGPWKKRRVMLMMGGLSNPVHYSGVGLVHYGAEKTAGILRMTASANNEILQPFSAIPDLLAQAVIQLQKKTVKNS